MPPKKNLKLSAVRLRSKPQKNPEKNIGSPAHLWRKPYFEFWVKENFFILFVTEILGNFCFLFDFLFFEV